MRKLTLCGAYRFILTVRHFVVCTPHAIFLNKLGFVSNFCSILMKKKSKMNCDLACQKHRRLKSFGRRFVEFWHDYFQSTGNSVRDLPIKSFISSVELVKLCELSACNCKNLVKNLFPEPTFVCKHCQNSFSTVTELNTHVAEMKKKAEKQQQKKKKQSLQQPTKQHQCIFCPKYLLSKISLIRHMELHTREYECEICQKAMNLNDVDRHKASRGHLKRVQSQLHHINSRRRRSCHL